MAVKQYIFALGFFDGVHLGHQALLRQCVALAQETAAVPAALTFLQHPQALFTAEPPALLTTDTDRDALLRRCGIQYIHKLPVTKEVMSTNWETFLADLLKKGAVGFVCGDDFHFGHRGEGNPEKLTAFCREHGLPCRIVEEQTLDGIRVSSTRIRRLIEEGSMNQAVRFLGHPHVLTGTVVSGRQLGRTIGIPTANLRLPDGIVQPRLGVYACRAICEDHAYLAVTNVGMRPTVEGHHVTVEPWLLDFAGDLYGKTLTLEFHEFLRPEEKFPSLEALRQEIRKNACQTREFFEKN